ncbi:hypothetical protein HHK36_030220 [Tetracentron sinense]|uniref:Large ribosomal subunit protein bL20c n=1 Tax=Tetracentron sinense TaxID=13715 RepID=A0A834YF55_TETSI|nr:hypothetical protein HHK36_030220 [Tetracentron sinense]
MALIWLNMNSFISAKRIVLGSDNFEMTPSFCRIEDNEVESDLKLPSQEESKKAPVNYGNFMRGLMKENIQLNRKVLSELSMHEPYSFKALVDISRNAFPGNKVVVPPKKEGISIVV